MTSSYLFGKTEPVLQIQAEVTVSWLLLSWRAKAIFLTSSPSTRTARPTTAAAEHLTHRLVVEVYVEVCRHLSPFSYIQQSQRHEEGFNLVEEIQLSHFWHINTLELPFFHKIAPLTSFNNILLVLFPKALVTSLEMKIPQKGLNQVKRILLSAAAVGQKSKLQQV